jgi:hypothetical protein
MKKPLICVIEPTAEAVWGFGYTEADAWREAKANMASWIHDNPKGHIDDLAVAQLRHDADLGVDGETLWQWVIYNAPVQGSLL